MSLIELLKRLPRRFSPGVAQRVLIVREVEGLPRKTLTLKLTDLQPGEFPSQAWTRRITALEFNARFHAHEPGAKPSLILFRDLVSEDAIYCGSTQHTDPDLGRMETHLVRVGEMIF